MRLEIADQGIIGPELQGMVKAVIDKVMPMAFHIGKIGCGIGRTPARIGLSFGPQPDLDIFVVTVGRGAFRASVAKQPMRHRKPPGENKFGHEKTLVGIAAHKAQKVGNVKRGTVLSEMLTGIDANQLAGDMARFDQI